MARKEKDGQHYMSSVKIGPKGQIVIPKEVRDMFGLAPGDALVLLADRRRGIALQRMEQLTPFLRSVFQTAPMEEEEEV